MSKKTISVSSKPKDNKEQDTRFEGWVQLKENGKHQKRYFVLAGPSLYCFKSNADTEPKAIYYLTDWQVVAVEGTKLKHMIHLVRERPVTEVEELLCLSAEDKVAWMGALMKEKNKILIARAPKAVAVLPEPEPEPVPTPTIASSVKQRIEEDAEHTFIHAKSNPTPAAAPPTTAASSSPIPPPTSTFTPPPATPAAPDSSLGIHAMMPTIIRCLQHLHRVGAESTPSIFQVPGDITELVRLKEQAASSSLDLTSAKDPLCVAQLVRLLLDGNVHEPLLRWDNARGLCDMMAFPTPLHRIDRVRGIIQTLPQDEQGVLRELMMFLHKVDKNVGTSRMNTTALSALFFKRIICSREVSLSLMAPDELERERQVYIELVATLIKRAYRLFNLSAQDSPLHRDESTPEATSFARQIGSDGLLFLMKQEVNDLYAKFSLIGNSGSSWRQLEQDVTHMRQDLFELKAHEANARLKSDKDLEEVDTLIDNVRPHYLDFPEKPVPRPATDRGGRSFSSTGSGIGTAPAGAAGNSANLYSSWVPAPRAGIGKR